MVKIAPSLLAGNYLDMGSSVRTAEQAGADYLHCDVMDGMFVPNISFGFKMLSSISHITSVPLDVHLMIEQPERYVERTAEAGASMITFHVEATPHVQRTLQQIHSCGAQAGIVLNPATPISFAKYVLDDVDMILLMSVNPGYGGQEFIPSSLTKVSDLRRLVTEYGKDIMIEVDGGISAQNTADVVRAGADVLVVGSAFFGAPDPAEVMRSIRQAAE